MKQEEGCNEDRKDHIAVRRSKIKNVFACRRGCIDSADAQGIGGSEIAANGDADEKKT